MIPLYAYFFIYLFVSVFANHSNEYVSMVFPRKFGSEINVGVKSEIYDLVSREIRWNLYLY